MKYSQIPRELLVTNIPITYPIWTIIIPTLSIKSENVDIEMQVCDRHTNEHPALKRLGGQFTGPKKRWRCSMDRISKVYRNRHQKTKLKIKFYLYLSDFYHQKIKKVCHMGIKIAKVLRRFPVLSYGAIYKWCAPPRFVQSSLYDSCDFGTRDLKAQWRFNYPNSQPKKKNGCHWFSLKIGWFFFNYSK